MDPVLVGTAKAPRPMPWRAPCSFWSWSRFLVFWRDIEWKSRVTACTRRLLLRGQTDHLGVPATRLMKKKNIVAFGGRSNLNPTKVSRTASLVVVVVKIDRSRPLWPQAELFLPTAQLTDKMKPVFGICNP